MKEYFSKYSSTYGPYEAVEMMCDKVKEIKKMVAHEDPNHYKELEILSIMIDDYIASTKGFSWAGKKPFRKGYKGPSHYHRSYNPSNVDNRQGGGGQQGEGYDGQGDGQGGHQPMPQGRTPGIQTGYPFGVNPYYPYPPIIR